MEKEDIKVGQKMRYNRVSNGDLCIITDIESDTVIYKCFTMKGVSRPDGLFEDTHDVICNFFDKVD